MDIGTALTAVTSIISIASLIAASTKTRVDDEWLGKLYRIVDLLAHERECAARYEEINRRLESGGKKMDRLEMMIWGMYPVFIGTIIATKFLV